MSTEYARSGQEAGRRPTEPSPASTAAIIFDYKGRTERATSDSEQDLTNGIIKVVSESNERSISLKDMANGYGILRPDRSMLHRSSVGAGELHGRESGQLPNREQCPDDASVVVAAGPKIDFFPNEIDALKRYLEKSGKLFLELDPPDKPDSPPLTNLIALAHDWGFDVGNNVVVDVSGMGRLIGTDASVPVVASYPSHPITERLQLSDRLSACPLDYAGFRWRQRSHRTNLHRNERAQLGGSRYQRRC